MGDGVFDEFPSELGSLSGCSCLESCFPFS